MLQSVIVELSLSLVRSLGRSLDFNSPVSLYTPFFIVSVLFNIRGNIYFICKLFFAIARTRYFFQMTTAENLMHLHDCNQ